jgi:hypothetical protein
MIDVSEIIHDPDFEQPITIRRTSGGHFEGSEYKSTTTDIVFRGVMVNPANSKEIQQTEQGDRATGYVNIYLDAKSEVYVTRERADGKNISDIVVENSGTAYEVKYRITSVYDRRMYGFVKAEAVRMGAL